MTRTISTKLRRAMNSQETGEVAIILLEIAHPDLSTPVLISQDPTTLLSDNPLQYVTISNGKNYLFLPFDIVLPDDVNESAPVASIVIENIDRRLIALLRSTSSPAAVTIMFVLASSPDTIEIQFPAFDLTSVKYDAMTITIGLEIDSLATEPYPAGSFDPSGFGGLF